MRAVLCLMGVAAMSAFSSVAMADEITIGADRDSCIYDEFFPTGNGSGQHMFCGKNNAGSQRRFMIRFDIAGAVPAGATIDNVRLELFMSRTDTGSFVYTLHRMTRDWGEGASDPGGNEGGGIDAVKGDATWDEAWYPNDPWVTPGGDFDAIVSASQTVNLEGPYVFGPANGMRDDVQAWLDDPSMNFGWIMVAPETAPLIASSKRFDSRQHAMPDKQPRLVISFTAGNPADFNGDGVVNGTDLATLLAQWGTNGSADLTGDEVVNGSDLAQLLANWG